MNQPPVDNTNWDLLSQFLFRPAARLPSTSESKATETAPAGDATASDAESADQAGENTPVVPEPQVREEAKRSCTPKQMEHIILRTLQAIDGCPIEGFEITVYGSNPWNAMLRITTAAKITALDAPRWRERTRLMVPVLRGQYDVANERNGERDSA